MKILKEICPPEPGKAIVIFYETYQKELKNPGEDNPQYYLKFVSSHCEMFTKSDLSSISMNAGSFVLRFFGRSGNEAQKFYFRNEEQVNRLAGLIEFCLGQGLRVKENYARLSINSLIKNITK